MKIHWLTGAPQQLRQQVKQLGVMSLLALGCGLAVLGFALVLDLLSLRELSASFSPAPLERLIVSARSRVHHVGAQWGEFVAALFGVVLAVASARLLTPTRR